MAGIEADHLKALLAQPVHEPGHQRPVSTPNPRSEPCRLRICVRASALMRQSAEVEWAALRRPG
jgi:hypothetical protein